MSDVVERLRQYGGVSWGTEACYNGTRDEAADAIVTLRAELAQARADIAERDARIAVVVGVLEKAATYVELCYSEEAGEEGEEARRDLAECNECIATLPAQAKALLDVVEAAKKVCDEQERIYTNDPRPLKYRAAFGAIADLMDALSTLSRPDGDGR